MFVSLDRLEGEFAVVLSGESEVVVPSSWLPDGAKEGDTLSLQLQISVLESDARAHEVEGRLDRLRAGSKTDTEFEL